MSEEAGVKPATLADLLWECLSDCSECLSLRVRTTGESDQCRRRGGETDEGGGGGIEVPAANTSQPQGQAGKACYGALEAAELHPHPQPPTAASLREILTLWSPNLGRLAFTVRSC